MVTLLVFVVGVFVGAGFAIGVWTYLKWRKFGGMVDAMPQMLADAGSRTHLPCAARVADGAVGGLDSSWREFFCAVEGTRLELSSLGGGRGRVAAEVVAPIDPQSARPVSSEELGVMNQRAVVLRVAIADGTLELGMIPAALDKLATEVNEALAPT